MTIRGDRTQGQEGRNKNREGDEMGVDGEARKEEDGGELASRRKRVVRPWSTCGVLPGFSSRQQSVTPFGRTHTSSIGRIV